MKRFISKYISPGRTSDEPKAKHHHGDIVEKVKSEGVCIRELQVSHGSSGPNFETKTKQKPVRTLAPSHEGLARSESPRLPTPPYGPLFNIHSKVDSKGPSQSNVYSLQRAPSNDNHVPIPSGSSTPASSKDSETNETDYLSVKNDNESASTSLSPTEPETPKIIVTAPSIHEQAKEEQDQNILGNLADAKASTLSVASIYTTSSALSFTPDDYFFDDNFLIPPCPENLLDQRRYRRAREHREVKKWLIEFLNNKGHQFPNKLRCRVMEIYGITHYDLAPGTVAKFDDEPQDEGIALNYADNFETVEGENTNAQLLRILRAFFQSQIQDITPKKDFTDPFSTLILERETPNRHSAQKKGIPSSRSVPGLRSAVIQNNNIYQIPSRPKLGRSLSTRSSTRRGTQANSLAQVPELQLPIQNSEKGKPHVLKKKSLSSMGKKTRDKRNNSISGTFGAVREALGGRLGINRRQTYDDA